VLVSEWESKIILLKYPYSIITALKNQFRNNFLFAFVEENVYPILKKHKSDIILVFCHIMFVFLSLFLLFSFAYYMHPRRTEIWGGPVGMRKKSGGQNILVVHFNHTISEKLVLQFLHSDTIVGGW
jgi:hypothetical protein